MENSITAVRRSLGRLEAWIEGHGYSGYEPFDGLSSTLRVLTFDRLLLQRLFQQAVRHSPFNLRPLLGIRPQPSTKGRGYMAWGYRERLKESGQLAYKAKMLEMLDWLDRNKSPRYSNHSWGNHFDYVSRQGTIPIHESTIVWTSLIGNVYVDAYEMLGLARHLEIIRSISRWILDLPREETSRGTCISYVAYTQSSIHNSNMLGAAFLSRASRHTRSVESSRLAADAMRYSCASQLPDGAWYYGEEPKNHWIDAYHTGYNLDSLKRYAEGRVDPLCGVCLEKGYQFFRDHFIEPNGCPRYYWNRTQPIDIQCASQVIDTLVQFSDIDPQALKLAMRTARWTIQNMQDPDGHFYYRRYPLGIVARAPMMHWGQATMYKALSSLLRAVSGKGARRTVSVREAS